MSELFPGKSDKKTAALVESKTGSKGEKGVSKCGVNNRTWPYFLSSMGLIKVGGREKKRKKKWGGRLLNLNKQKKGRIEIKSLQSPMFLIKLPLHHVQESREKRSRKASKEKKKPGRKKRDQIDKKAAEAWASSASEPGKKGTFSLG